MVDSLLLTLPSATTLDGTESVYIVQNGEDKKSSTALMTTTSVLAPMSLDTQVLYNRNGVIDGADGIRYDNITNRTFFISDGTAPITTMSTAATAVFQNTSGANVVHIVAGATSTANIWLGTSTTPSLGRIVYDNSTNALSFWTSSTLALTIASNNNTTFNGAIISANSATSAAFQSQATITNSNLGVVVSGSATTTVATLIFAGAATINYRMIMRGGTASTPAAGTSYGSFIVGQHAVTIASSGTHGLFAQQVIKSLSVSAGTGTLTRTASLYIDGAATATVTDNNYALYTATTIPFSVDGIGAVMGQSTQLFRIDNLSSTTTANTLAYTNNTGRTLVIAQVGVVCTAATAITTGPNIGIGTAAGTSDIFAATAMNGLISTSRAHFLTATSGVAVVPNGGTIYINLTAATGTSQTISLGFMGFAV